jgi:hypothetical protein
MKVKFRFKMIDGTTSEITVAKSSLTLGRSKKNDIYIKDEGLSRKHCKFDVNPEGELFITDLHSTNGVLIEGSRIIPGVPVKYPFFLSLTIGPIVCLEMTLSRDQDRKSIISGATLKGTNNNVTTDAANSSWHLRTRKKQNRFWIFILFVFLMTCFLYVLFNAKIEDDFALPNSPKSLKF